MKKLPSLLLAAALVLGCEETKSPEASVAHVRADLKLNFKPDPTLPNCNYIHQKLIIEEGLNGELELDCYSPRLKSE